MKRGKFVVEHVQINSNTSAAAAAGGGGGSGGGGAPALAATPPVAKLGRPLVAARDCNMAYEAAGGGTCGNAAVRRPLGQLSVLHERLPSLRPSSCASAANTRYRASLQSFIVEQQSSARAEGDLTMNIAKIPTAPTAPHSTSARVRSGVTKSFQPTRSGTALGDNSFSRRAAAVSSARGGDSRLFWRRRGDSDI